MAGLYLYVEFLAKGLRGPPDQLTDIVDKLADKIGYPSGRV
jgi:hypothetical protein